MTTNTVGLMLQNALNSRFDAGLGLVRVQWRLDSFHDRSARLAERMGFKYEGKQRWFRLIKNGVARGKVGNEKHPPPFSEEGDVWQDRITYSMCWDDWHEGGHMQTITAMMSDEHGGALTCNIPANDWSVQLHAAWSV